jgi:hypothetical protein
MNKGHKYRLPLRSSNKAETCPFFMGNNHDIRDRRVSMRVGVININKYMYILPPLNFTRLVEKYTRPVIGLSMSLNLKFGQELLFNQL